MRKLEDLEISSLAMKIGDIVWAEVYKWDYFSRTALGLQWVKAIDSIAANLAEGYGRNSTKEGLQFCYYSRGSLKEASCFLEKSFNRHLVSEEFYNMASKDSEVLGKMMNSYINYLKRG